MQLDVSLTLNLGQPLVVQVVVDDPKTSIKLDQILTLLTNVVTKETRIMSVLDDLTVQVAVNTDTEASAVKLIQNLAQLLAAAGTDPVKLKALQDTLNNSQIALAAAIVANTQAPPPTPAPAPVPPTV